MKKTIVLIVNVNSFGIIYCTNIKFKENSNENKVL